MAPGGQTTEDQIAFLLRFLNDIEPYSALSGYRGEYIRELAEQVRLTIRAYQGQAGAG